MTQPSHTAPIDADAPHDAPSDCRDTAFGADTEHDHPPAVEHHPLSGVAFALAAYAWWGFVVPTFFWALGRAGPGELMAMRILTGLPVALALIAWSGRMRELRDAALSWRTYRYLLLTTALIAVNWFGFIVVITTDGLQLQASLGYYITPLLSVALGMIVLGERLRPLQIVALAMAGAGVLALATSGQFPTWALVLAVSFSLYGLLRKRAHVGPMVGITIEMANLFPLAAAFMAFSWLTQGLSIGALPHPKLALVFLAGAITVAPLLWFNHGAKRLRLSTLGFIQFLAPTGQFLLAVLLMDQEFKGVRALTFSLIWLAITVFCIDSVRHHRGERRMTRKPPGS